MDLDSASISVLEKFGLTSRPTVSHSGKDTPPEISFGRFSVPFSRDNHNLFWIGVVNLPIRSGSSDKLPSYQGHRFKQLLWDSIPDDKLHHILDG